MVVGVWGTIQYSTALAVNAHFIAGTSDFSRTPVGNTNFTSPPTTQVWRKQDTFNTRWIKLGATSRRLRQNRDRGRYNLRWNFRPSRLRKSIRVWSASVLSLATSDLRQQLFSHFPADFYVSCGVVASLYGRGHAKLERNEVVT